MIRQFVRPNVGGEQIGPPAGFYTIQSSVWPYGSAHAIVFGQTLMATIGAGAAMQHYELELWVGGVRVANSGLRESVPLGSGDEFTSLHCFGYAKIMTGTLLELRLQIVDDQGFLYDNKTQIAVIT